ncbi:DUF29 family protein [Chroococcidiopsis sp. TS-821]|uniref:DUF29 family protein n=1 Tax=Chroococcidiopsis sp. TS-821 TaxID=1378066 RepID=UPI000CEF45ED|nr:DUF29 family protein [Chroococcidiopsis sp. TS-821]PPS39185.1 hypothetical protein B1A85_22605 [Chroococcidiopsis sp. TS-821]
MEELAELREKILRGDLSSALAIVDELEEMSRDDKINNIQSYAVVLLKHLIKQYAEKRTTKSWNVSIRNSAFKIKELNKRRKAGGHYLNSEELKECFESVFAVALNSASLEIFEGVLEPEEIEAMIDKDVIIQRALVECQA